jgi:cytoskeletal protein RodZ
MKPRRVGENVRLPLVIVVVVVLAVALVWRGRTSRRLTIEQSVDRYRRTLSAVHDASTRSRTAEGKTTAAPLTYSTRSSSTRSAPRISRWRLALVAAMAVATIAAGAAVLAANRKNGSPRASVATTTLPPATHPTTTTRPAAPTTTIPLLTATDGSGTAFNVSRPTYTLVVQTNTGPCWLDARDASGTRLFSGTLSPGQSQSIAGVVTVQLGNPGAVSLTVDGTPVPFAQAGGSPVTLHFQSIPAQSPA